MSDLTDVLGQSQPRVSRHVKLLDDAGIVVRSREGAWVFVRLTADPATAAVVDAVFAGLDVSDHLLASDIDRLAAVRAQRTEAARGATSSASPRVGTKSERCTPRPPPWRRRSSSCSVPTRSGRCAIWAPGPVG